MLTGHMETHKPMEDSDFNDSEDELEETQYETREETETMEETGTHSPTSTLPSPTLSSIHPLLPPPSPPSTLSSLQEIFQFYSDKIFQEIFQFYIYIRVVFIHQPYCDCVMCPVWWDTNTHG